MISVDSLFQKGLKMSLGQEEYEVSPLPTQAEVDRLTIRINHELHDGTVVIFSLAGGKVVVSKWTAGPPLDPQDFP